MVREDDSDGEAGNPGGLIEQKLPLITSPVYHVREIERQNSLPRAVSGRDLEHLGWRHGVNHNCPEFVKHSGSTNYEMFFDLWFVANLGVYNDSHGGNTDAGKLWAYLGYLVILWTTWFLVGMFDVRFVTDSVFERLARTAHLAVMVGFAVVGPVFNPVDQNPAAFRSLSLILMVSRLVLVVQYASIAWHIRRYREGKWQVAAVAALHLVAAVVYLGISTRFGDGRSSRVFLVWYILGIAEALVHLSAGLFFRALSFEGTHLTERMTVLTLIILGEGVMSIAKNVALIVKNQGWTSATIGVLTSAIAMVYMFFMIYFDWMNHNHLRNVRQAVWTLLHFPFHVGLLLFMDGASNFITFWKILELQTWASDTFMAAVDAIGNDPDAEPTSAYIANKLDETVMYIWTMYKPTYTFTISEITRVLDDVRDIPDEYWLDPNPVPDIDARLSNDTTDLLVTVVNSLFVNFKIDPMEDSTEVDFRKMQYDAYESTFDRFVVVWQYTYLCAGLVLILLTVLHIIAKKRGWTPFNLFRSATFLLLGAGCCLVLLLSNDELRGTAFLQSPWLLPTLCLVFLFVLIMTHLPTPPPLFFGRSPGGSSGRSDAAIPSLATAAPRNVAGVRAAGYTTVQIHDGTEGDVAYDGAYQVEKDRPGGRTTA